LSEDNGDRPRPYSCERAKERNNIYLCFQWLNIWWCWIDSTVLVALGGSVKKSRWVLRMFWTNRPLNREKLIRHYDLLITCKRTTRHFLQTNPPNEKIIASLKFSKTRVPNNRVEYHVTRYTISGTFHLSKKCFLKNLFLSSFHIIWKLTWNLLLLILVRNLKTTSSSYVGYTYFIIRLQ